MRDDRKMSQWEELPQAQRMSVQIMPNILEETPATATRPSADCNEFLLCLPVLQLCPISSASDTPLSFQYPQVSPGLDIFNSSNSSSTQPSRLLEVYPPQAPPGRRLTRCHSRIVGVSLWFFGSYSTAYIRMVNRFLVTGSLFTTLTRE